LAGDCPEAVVTRLQAMLTACWRREREDRKAKADRAAAMEREYATARTEPPGARVDADIAVKQRVLFFLRA
jgi:hypothetical protein